MEVYKTTEMPCALQELKKAIVSYVNRPVDKWNVLLLFFQRNMPGFLLIPWHIALYEMVPGRSMSV